MELNRKVALDSVFTMGVLVLTTYQRNVERTLETLLRLILQSSYHGLLSLEIKSSILMPSMARVLLLSSMNMPKKKKKLIRTLDSQPTHDAPIVAHPKPTCTPSNSAENLPFSPSGITALRPCQMSLGEGSFMATYFTLVTVLNR